MANLSMARSILVNTPGHPERGLRPEHFGLFAPRIGVAYRLTDKTVIRTGGGIFFIPATVQFPEGPYGNLVNYVTQVMVGTVNNNATPQNTLSDPFPGGFQTPPGETRIIRRCCSAATIAPRWNTAHTVIRNNGTSRCSIS